jgi:hypothetical protein
VRFSPAIDTDAPNVLHPAKPLNSVAANQQRGPEAAPPTGRQSKRPANRKVGREYKKIDEALKEIAKANPESHNKVFNSLDARKIPTPNARPFNTPPGAVPVRSQKLGPWMAAFNRDRRTAQSWLSKRWAFLELLPFPRGPKKK